MFNSRILHRECFVVASFDDRFLHWWLLKSLPTNFMVWIECECESKLLGRGRMGRCGGEEDMKILSWSKFDLEILVNKCEPSQMKWVFSTEFNCRRSSRKTIKETKRARKKNQKRNRKKKSCNVIRCMEFFSFNYFNGRFEATQLHTSKMWFCAFILLQPTKYNVHTF